MLCVSCVLCVFHEEACAACVSRMREVRFQPLVWGPAVNRPPRRAMTPVTTQETPFFKYIEDRPDHTDQSLQMLHRWVWEVPFSLLADATQMGVGGS